MSIYIPRIALTAGEPAGIGPELCAMIAQNPYPAEIIVIADPNLMKERALTVNLPLTLKPLNPSSQPQQHQEGHLTYIQAPLQADCQCSVVNKHNASYVLNTLDLSIKGCLTGEFSALVTAPVHKGIINDAGIPFSGHTEYLAHQSNTKSVVMMLATKGLRVALATTHLPLKNVADAINQQSLEQTLRILQNELTHHFGIRNPHILVCGLNPHAGEGGHLGHEENETIIPVINKLNRQGYNLTGPLPADTLFTPHNLAHCDAVLAMYHDQGLPVLKHKGFNNSINITLGLPFIRTSVDHGTALELAGTGQANSESLDLAITTAIELANASQSKQVAASHARTTH